MAEVSIARTLRVGTPEGEHATAVMIVDSVETSSSGRSILEHFTVLLANSIISNTSQAKGMILVAFSYSPEDYDFLFRNRLRGSNPVHVMDCFSDPLGWEKPRSSAQHQDIRNLDTFTAAIEAAGKAILANEVKGRFSLVLDSLTELLRHHSVAAVTRFIGQLRALDSLSAIIWVIHGDLYETRLVNSFSYLATAVAHVEPQVECLSTSKNAGRLRIRQKRRNGRVREQIDEFEVLDSLLKFSPVQKALKPQNATSNHHQVNFRLDLSDKEHQDRAKVVLPFEHQGNGKEISIYDGRAESEEHRENKEGQIYYVRDSDDEFPDSDEDPDDDLDI